MFAISLAGFSLAFNLREKITEQSSYLPPSIILTVQKLVHFVYNRLDGGCALSALLSPLARCLQRHGEFTKFLPISSFLKRYV